MILKLVLSHLMEWLCFGNANNYLWANSKKKQSGCQGYLPEETGGGAGVFAWWADFGSAEPRVQARSLSA
jgi:hypothetical protein